MDVAVRGGKIARVGLSVTPGLIDIHVHVYPHRGPHGPTWQFSVIPDAHSFRAGVTTFVDAGTAGADHFADFKSRWIDTARTRVLAFVNIAAGSMGDAEQDPAQFDPRRAAGVRADRPVMVDFWPRPPERPSPDLILEPLRPGDIHPHVFARQFPIVRPD